MNWVANITSDLSLTKQLGVHMWETTVAEANLTILVRSSKLSTTTQHIFINTIQLLLVASITYLPLVAFAKISLLISYRKFSISRWLSLAATITIAMIAAYSLAIMFAILFACTPIQKGWDITVTEGNCINRDALYIAAVATNVATDLILLILPIPVMVQLKLPAVQKVGLLCMFAVGSL